MSDTEQKVEAPVKSKRPMDETRLSQLAAARELAVKARKDKAMLKQNEKLLAEAEAAAKAREVDEKLKRLKKTKVASSSESDSEEEVQPKRVKREVPREPMSASRTQIQHELQMMRRQMAMRAMFQAPAF
jgi:hypothetical protein